MAFSTLRYQTYILLPLLLLLGSTVFSQPAAIIDSLNGSALVQRAGSVKWDSISGDDKLFNNDVIRIAQGSFGIIRWPDNSQAFAHGGTQILVNIGPENRPKVLSYATVFVGSVFFVIKKVLPQKLIEDIQVYTPTSVISIRGTSFAVQVAEKTGTSTIKMISGTVRVRSIDKNASAFLSAPFKTIIEKKTARILTSALLTADVDSLKSWVPGNVINVEMSKHLAKSKRDQRILSGTMYDTCSLLPFTNISAYKGDWDLSGVIPKLIAQRIKASTNRLYIRMPDSTSNTALPADTPSPRFTVSGEITFFDIVDHAEITVRADEYRERSVGRVSITLVLTDSKHTDEPFTATVTGERSGKKSVENSWTTIGTYPFSLENDKFSSSLIGSALDQALDAASEKIILQMYE